MAIFSVQKEENKEAELLNSGFYLVLYTSTHFIISPLKVISQIHGDHQH